MNLNRIGLLVGILLGTLTVLKPEEPVFAGCRVNCWSRDCASRYGYTAVNEPYSVTHAEWKDDDMLSWVGEGVDCSGLVNKAWGMKDNSGSIEFFWRYTLESLPAEKYYARNFYDECGGTGACVKVCQTSTSLTDCPYSVTEPMDAFVTLNNIIDPNDDHIGLIYLEDIAGYDWILEAVNQENTYIDVRIAEHSWRIMTGYRGISRVSWSSNSSCSGSTCPASCPIYLPSVSRGQWIYNNFFEYDYSYPDPEFAYPYP